MKRIAAVITLALLSPLIAEFLSGSLSLEQIAAMPVMLAMYGGGAVLIREVVRRSGRGWPSILLLGLAYALIEEGLADQSLFNPNFDGLRLIDPGFIPALGIGVPWTIYVLAIHVIWSIAVPIALAEGLFPSIAGERWLGIGVGVVAFFYVAGVAAITLFFARNFFAAPAQIAGALILAAVFALAAFLLPRPQAEARLPHAWISGVVGFGATAGLVALYGHGVSVWPWPAVAGGMLLLLIVLLGAGHRVQGSRAHVTALAAGACLTYVWSGFYTEIALHGRAMLPAHAVLAAIILVVIAVAGVKSRRIPAAE
jgi:hypothetical protein